MQLILQPGEIVSLIGMPGTGKSALIKLLYGEVSELGSENID